MRVFLLSSPRIIIHIELNSEYISETTLTLFFVMFFEFSALRCLIIIIELINLENTMPKWKTQTLCTHTHTPTETIFILVMIMLRRWCDDDHNACSWLPPMLLLMLPIKFEGKFVLCLKNFPTYENRRRKFLWKYIFSYSSSSCLPYMRYNVRAAQTYCKEINKTWKKMWMGAGC